MNQIYLPRPLFNHARLTAVDVVLDNGRQNAAVVAVRARQSRWHRRRINAVLMRPIIICHN
mgnify:CR=1 FL=1